MSYQYVEVENSILADNIDNNTLKHNNPKNMYQSQVNKRKAKEMKNLASKGLSPQTLDSSLSNSPAKRLSRFERADCESSSAEVDNLESNSKSTNFLRRSRPFKNLLFCDAFVIFEWSFENSEFG